MRFGSRGPYGREGAEFRAQCARCGTLPIINLFSGVLAG
jgi:hypothetical protein